MCVDRRAASPGSSRDLLTDATHKRHPRNITTRTIPDTVALSTAETGGYKAGMHSGPDSRLHVHGWNDDPGMRGAGRKTLAAVLFQI